jgi:hypothetical protein
MDIKELDVVTLNDGRQGTVIDIQRKDDEAVYLIEIPGIDFFSCPYVHSKDIKSIDWRDDGGQPSKKTA